MQLAASQLSSLRIAVDAMGGDHAPEAHRRRRAAWPRVVCRSACCSSATAALDRARAAHGIPASGAIDVEILARARAHRDGGVGGGGAAAQAAGVDSRRGRSRARRAGRGAVQRRPHRRRP